MTTAPAIGQWVRRDDGGSKVTGRAVYTGDLTLPRMLHARLVLSPYAHARITRIDADEARAMPGVVGVYTADDLPLIKPKNLTRNRDPLARDQVLFDGHPVVAVLAETEQQAEDAAGAVTVEYEEAESAVDPEAVLADSRELVHPKEMLGEREDAGTHSSVGESSEKITRPANATAAARYRRGDVEAGFAEADLVVEYTYRTPWVHQGYLEPQSCVAAPDGAGHITIYTSTQAAYQTRGDVAASLGIAHQNVKVVAMELGGGFGAKYALLDPLVAGLAWKVGRPVRLVFTRNEEFRSANPAPATVMHVKTGAKRDGRLTALQATIIVDTGAYPGGTAGIVCALLGGTYRWPNLLIDGYDVLTHKPGTGAYRAPGAPQACFAIEGQIDELARRLDLDPLEFRLQNAVVEGDPLPDGNAWASLGGREVLQALRDHPTWRNRARKGPGEGVGIAFGGWAGGSEHAAAACRLNDDGTLTVVVGSIDVSGTRTGMILLAANAFGVAPEKVNVVMADTDTAPYAGASGGSQITLGVGAAVINAAADARRQVLAIAAERLEVAPEDLDIVEDRVEVRGVPGRGIDLEEISGGAGGNFEPIYGRGGAAPAAAGPGFVAHLAHIHVDEETGVVRVLDYVAVQDVGRALNPAGIHDQICGGVAQGIGWALYEQMSYDSDGRLQTGTLMDYTLPSSLQVSSITPILVEVPFSEGPLGGRGVGEPPVVPGAAVIANALADATGIRPTEIPLTPERVLKALQARQPAAL